MMKRLLPFLLLIVASSTQAESGAYRVEAIIFQNLAVDLDVATDANEHDELRSFSGFPALEESNLPDDLVPLMERSTHMDGVWRRLRSSKRYRPLVFAAWEQNRTDYYPPMRIHDDMVLDTRLQAPAGIMMADLAAEDPLAAYRINFYRLDGTIQLRRSRFLHLYLDLEIREQTPRTGPQANFFNDNPGTDGIIEEKQIYSLFSLRQNRQIQTNNMQYFDTPYFGVLVYVTPILAEQD